MKQFRHLLLLGAVLVTLLFIIDSIDAKKKEHKRKEVETNYENGIGNSKNSKSGKFKKSENSKSEKPKKSHEYRTFNSEDLSNKENKFETNKNGKKNIKENVNPKITKTYQKVKKYKVEDILSKKFSSNKQVPRKSASQPTCPNVEDIYEPLKKTSQKKPAKEGNSLNGVKNEEPNELNEEENIFIVEGDFGTNQNKRAYKLVEIGLGEEEDNLEGNETLAEVGLEDEEEIGGIERTESEEVIEKYKRTQTLKLPKTKKGSNYNPNNGVEGELINDGQELNDMFIDEESYYSRYENPHGQNNFQRCKPLPEDPNRKGPKKLTFYLMEEEVDGKKSKYLAPEEDGLTMCEVADLLAAQYKSGLN